MRFKLILSLLIGLAIPTAFIWWWYDSSTIEINEFLLITHDKIKTTGFIIQAEEYDDLVESDYNRSAGVVYDFSFKYVFKLKDGSVRSSYGKENGRLPGFLSNVDNKPYPVKIEYLANNPNISRVKEYWSGNVSLFDWFRHRMVMWTILFLCCTIIGYINIKYGIKKYLTEKAELEKFAIEYRKQKLQKE